MTCIENHALNGDSSRAQAFFIGCLFFGRVPFVTDSTAEQHGLDTCQSIRFEFWRNVSATCNDAGNGLIQPGCRPERHCDTLRKTGEHELGRRFLREGIYDILHIHNIVGDREFPVLPRHPARNDFVHASPVELMQPLNRHHSPTVDSRNRLQSAQFVIGRLTVTVETQKQRGI